MLFPGLRADDLQLLIGEIDSGLQLSQQGKQFVLNRGYFFLEFTFQQLVGLNQGLITLGLEQFDDPFGLGQIDAAVQEGPEGKFTGFGQTGPGFRTRFRIFFRTRGPLWQLISTRSSRV